MVSQLAPACPDLSGIFGKVNNAGKDNYSILKLIEQRHP